MTLTVCRRAALTLTPQAVQRVKQLTEGVPDCLGLRIGVKQRGCNGMSYTLDYAQTKEKFDEIVTQDGIKIFIDKKAQLSILGNLPEVLLFILTLKRKYLQEQRWTL